MEETNESSSSSSSSFHWRRLLMVACAIGATIILAASAFGGFNAFHPNGGDDGGYEESRALRGEVVELDKTLLSSSSFAAQADHFGLVITSEHHDSSSSTKKQTVILEKAPPRIHNGIHHHTTQAQLVKEREFITSESDEDEQEDVTAVLEKAPLKVHRDKKDPAVYHVHFEDLDENASSEDIAKALSKALKSGNKDEESISAAMAENLQNESGDEAPYVTVQLEKAPPRIHNGRHHKKDRAPAVYHVYLEDSEDNFDSKDVGLALSKAITSGNDDDEAISDAVAGNLKESRQQDDTTHISLEEKP